MTGLKLFRLSLIVDKDGDYVAEKIGLGAWTGARGFIVIAANKTQARQLAVAAADKSGEAIWWLKPSMTKIEEIDLTEPGAVMGNWPTG